MGSDCISSCSLLIFFFSLLSVLEIGQKMMTSSKRAMYHGLLLFCIRFLLRIIEM